MNTEALPEHSAASVRRRRLPPSNDADISAPADAIPSPPTPAAVFAQRLRMHDKGFGPVPLLTGEKHTDQRGWPEAAKLPPGDVNVRYLNTGMLCAGLRVPDIDIDDPELAQKVDDLAEQELGPAPIRSRADSPRRARIYRAAVGEPGKRVAQGPVLGKNAAGKPIQNKVEILGSGQQLHAFGPHPDGATLEWTAAPGDIGLADLTVVTEEQIHNFLAKVAVLIGAVVIDAKAPPAGATPSLSNASVSSGADFMLRPDPRADVADVAAALEVIPNKDATDWGMWNHIGMAAWRATDGSEEGFEAFDKWSALSGRDNPVTTRGRWEHYRSSPPTTVGAHTLFYHAAQAVPGWRKPSIAALKGDAHGGSEDDGDGFVDFADEDETPVKFGVEGLLEPQGVCGVFAAPSQGKTGVKNLLKVSYVTGLPFLGREVHTPGIVLSYVLEDRINAKHLLRIACEGMGVDPARLNGRVFFNSREKGLSLPSDTKQVFADIAKIEQRTGEKVVAVFIDTIREASPSGSMSDQKDITPLLAAFKEIGRDRMVFVCGHVSVENSRLPLEERNPMGSGDFLARLDTVLHLETCIGKDAAEGFGRVWVQKVRNGPARYSIPLKIRRASSGLPVPALDTSGEVRPAAQPQGRKAAAEGGKSKHAPSNPFEDARTVKVAVAVLRKERHKAHRTSAVAEMMLQEEHFDIGAKSLAERIKKLSRNKDCLLHKMFSPAKPTDQAWRFYDHAAAGDPFTPLWSIRSRRSSGDNGCTGHTASRGNGCKGHTASRGNGANTGRTKGRQTCRTDKEASRHGCGGLGMTALPVACRNAPAGQTTWWPGDGWNVTSYGLEATDGGNSISARRLPDYHLTGGLRWVAAMSELPAEEFDGFLSAFAVALALHGHTDVDPALVPASAKAYRKALRRAAYEASVKAAEMAKAKKPKPPKPRPAPTCMEAPMQ